MVRIAVGDSNGFDGGFCEEKKTINTALRQGFTLHTYSTRDGTRDSNGMLASFMVRNLYSSLESSFTGFSRNSILKKVRLLAMSKCFHRNT